MSEVHIDIFERVFTKIFRTTLLLLLIFQPGSLIGMLPLRSQQWLRQFEVIILNFKSLVVSDIKMILRIVRMEDHSWYVGPMERIEANTKLAPYPSNTFLVRSKMVNGEITSHVVSMKTDSDIKHMRIETEVSKSASFDEDENGVRIKVNRETIIILKWKYLSGT